MHRNKIKSTGYIDELIESMPPVDLHQGGYCLNCIERLHSGFVPANPRFFPLGECSMCGTIRTVFDPDTLVPGPPYGNGSAYVLWEDEVAVKPSLLDRIKSWF